MLELIDRAAGEFRGLPPSARDQLQHELGDKIVMQSSDWNCGNVITPNHKKKPFDDVRVRRTNARAGARKPAWTPPAPQPQPATTNAADIASPAPAAQP